MNDDQEIINDSSIYSEIKEALSKDRIYQREIHNLTVDNCEQKLEQAVKYIRHGNIILIALTCTIAFISTGGSQGEFAKAVFYSLLVLYLASTLRTKSRYEERLYALLHLWRKRKLTEQSTE